MKARRILSSESGTTVVEFGVIAPVMFVLLFAGFDFGHTLYMRSVLQGAVNKAARDSSLETGTVQQVQQAVDDKVAEQVHAINNTAQLTYKRNYYRTFNDAAFPESEVWADTNNNGECDNDEIYLDENNNNEFDADGLADGQGYTRDAVSYTVTAKYDRIMPLAGLLGWSNEVELSAATTIANQPYGQRGEILSRKCDA